jgi:hypothetical protein
MIGHARDLGGSVAAAHATSSSRNVVFNAESIGKTMGVKP